MEILVIQIVIGNLWGECYETCFYEWRIGKSVIPIYFSAMDGN